MSVASMTIVSAGVACGQDYPNKPIRIITAEAGGGSEFGARIIAPGLTSGLGQQVIVDNRPASLMGEIVFRAPPDGYTLLLIGGTFWIGPLLQSTPYDPVRDFSPITMTNRQPNVLVVHPSLPVKSIKELIAVAKGRPGELSYAYAGTPGGSGHLAGELFKSMVGVNIAPIPYRGTGPALNALIGGEVQLMFATAGAVASHIKSGRLRALAVTSAEPSALLPGLSTVAASGLPGYESGVVYGMFAPAKTPEPVIKRLNQEIVRVLNRADVKERFLNGGSETVGSSPEELTAKMKSEMVRLGKVIKDAGIRIE